MYVSGMTIQSKKISVSRKSQIPKPQQMRPCSSELPEIPELRSNTINKFNNIQSIKEKARNSSHNKIYMTNKIKEKNQDVVLREYSTENKLASKPIRKKEIVPINRKSKKLELSKQDEDCLFQNQQKLLAFYRYYPVAIITACGFRQELMKGLTQKQISVYTPKSKKQPRKGIQQLWNKLIKLAMLKGKYKFRQKFNFLYSAQLKALNFKRKELKRKKQSESSSSDDEMQRKQKCRDMQSWKRSMGVQGSKVFIVKGKYKDLRNALLERGWVENQDNQSLFYDLKWTTKVKDINFQSVKPHQLVNHFNNNACLTSKYGICKSLRSIMYSQSIDVDKFFPKAYDISDIQDFQNFLEIYKWIYCQSYLKKYQKQNTPNLQEEMKTKVSYIVTHRRLLKGEKLLVNLINSKFNICSVNQWKFLTSQKDFKIEEIHQTLLKWQILEISWEQFQIKIRQMLSKLQGRQPQFQLNGTDNIWIVKPAFLSRGRGIKCISDLTDILDYSLGKQTQYVVQKYIENPLIINKRKFDIRQWVIVQDYSPPKIWIYSEFYVRFCLEEYNPSKLNNKFAHLTNNSIQKYNSKINAEQLANQSMWTMEQLMKFIEETYGEGKFKEVVARMKQIVVATIVSTQDQVYGRKNSFELIGYDFMIDDLLNPWLIEINSSPSMDYSTPVTRRLVKMVLEDTIKVVVDLKKKKNKKKNAGLFKCVYDGQGNYEFKRYKMNEQQQ